MEMFHEFFFSNLILVSLCVINKYRENGTGKNLKKYMFFFNFPATSGITLLPDKRVGISNFSNFKAL